MNQKDKKDKSKISHLQQLLESKGWEIIKKQIDEWTAYNTDKALDISDHEMREKLEITKREFHIMRREYCKKLSELPQTLIKSFEKNEPIEQPSDNQFDPYDPEPQEPKLKWN